MKIDKINTKIRRVSNSRIFHDTRSDVVKLAKVVNALIEKVNELVEEHNKQEDNNEDK